jgi:hypothetical protein
MSLVGLEMIIGGIPKGPMDIVKIVKVVISGKEAIYD